MNPLSYNQQGPRNQPVTNPFAQPRPQGRSQFNSGQTSFKPGYGPGLTAGLTGLGSSIAARQVANKINPGGSAFASSPAGIGTGIGISMAGNWAADKLKPKEEMPWYGGQHGDLTDRYGRRFEGAGPGVAGGAVRGATYGSDPALLASTMGLSAPIGAAIGAIAGAVTKNAPSAFSDFSSGDAYSILGDAYKKYLGRDASDDEIMGRLRGQGYKPEEGHRWVGQKNLFSQLDFIRDSPEAQAYAARQAGGPEAPEAVPGAHEQPIAQPLPFERNPNAVSDFERSMGLPSGSIQTSQGGPGLPRLDPNTGQYSSPPQGNPFGGMQQFSPDQLAGTVHALNPEQAQQLTDYNNQRTSRLGALDQETQQYQAAGWDGRNETRPSDVMGQQEAEREALYRSLGIGSPGGYASQTAAAQTAPQASGSWNTDGYSTPQVTAQGFNQQAPPGWDQTKWNDPNHQTPKYVWGRLTQDSDPNDIDQLLAAYPGATFNGKDKVTIPGVGTIDVYKGASVGLNEPQWLDESAAGGGQTGPLTGVTMPGASGTPRGPRFMGYGSDDYSDAVLQYLLQGLGLEQAANRMSR